MRTAAPTDYFVDVDGVGRFSFAKRTMRDEMRIGVEYSRLTEGEDNISDWLRTFAIAMATLSVLMVSAPDGFALDDLDPLDPNSYGKVLDTFRAMRAKEDSFRPGLSKAGEAGGAGSGGLDRVLVPAQVQPAAE